MFFNVRVGKVDLLISETFDNCDGTFHSFEYNVQIGVVILKIKKNGRFQKTNWIREVTIQLRTNLIKANIRY